MNVEFVVVWNGSHNGQDEDLLSEGVRVTTKVQAEPPRRQRGQAREAVLEALSTLQSRARTMRELMALTGCHGQAVNSVLYKLRQEGILRSEPMPGSRGARPPQMYWRWPR